MKITNLIVPMVALSTINNPNYQVQAAQVEWQMLVNSNNCISGCVAVQVAGAKICSATWVNPPAYYTCISAVGAAFTLCCIAC